MAAIASTQTGDWNVGATWVGGVAPGAADTATIANAHVVTVTANQAVLGVTIDAGGELVVAAGIALTGMTGLLNLDGTMTMAAGSTVSFNTATLAILDVKGALYVNGTSGARCTINNIGAGYANVRASAHSCIIAADWLDTESYYPAGDYAWTKIRFRDTEFDTSAHNIAQTIQVRGTMSLERCFVAPQSTDCGIQCPYEGAGLTGNDICIGYKRDGSASPATTGITNSTDCGAIEIRNCTINATTPLSLGSYFNMRNSIRIDNYGHICDAMLPGTGSALDGAVVGPGVGYYRDYMGTIERSTAAKKTGDYGSRFTPTTYSSEILALESSIYVPIETGDDISVSVYGRRHTMTNDCAEVEIDPEGAWFTPNTSAPTLTDDDTWYEFTPSASGAGGSTDKGMVRIVLRLKEYEAGAYFDWADMVVTVS